MPPILLASIFEVLVLGPSASSLLRPVSQVVHGLLLIKVVLHHGAEEGIDLDIVQGLLIVSLIDVVFGRDLDIAGLSQVG
jgi:hypothetical protein